MSRAPPHTIVRVAESIRISPRKREPRAPVARSSATRTHWLQLPHCANIAAISSPPTRPLPDTSARPAAIAFMPQAASNTARSAPFTKPSILRSALHASGTIVHEYVSRSHCVRSVSLRTLVVGSVTTNCNCVPAGAAARLVVSNETPVAPGISTPARYHCLLSECNDGFTSVVPITARRTTMLLNGRVAASTIVVC